MFEEEEEEGTMVADEFDVDNVEEEPFDPYISELQDAVEEMKSAFLSAQTQLEGIREGDNSLKVEIETQKSECQQKTAEITSLILSLKAEIISLREMVQNGQMSQLSLQSTLHSMILERDILLDELAKYGILSQSFTRGLRHRQGLLRSTSSNSQSNSEDSGVALLLERTNAVFNHGLNSLMMMSPPGGDGNRGSLLNNGIGGNAGSQEDGPPRGVEGEDSMLHPHMHDFLKYGQFAMPHQPNTSGLDTKTDPFHLYHHQSYTDGTNHYDSDSSLTMAAAKSLSLSTSLSKQCGLELDRRDERNNSKLNLAEDESNVKSSTPISNYTDDRENQKNGAETAEELTARNDQESHRLKVAKELLTTEQKYCRTLRTIQDTFAQPLKSSGILSLKDINTLFPEEVYDLYTKHQEFLSELEERIADWKNQPTIGDIIERFTNIEGSDVLRLYTNYVNDFPEVLKTFHKLCRTSGDFTRFLKSCLENPNCGGLDLGSFLLTPVQRMPRYILLLKQMIKFTEPNHPDFKNINFCLERLRDYLKRLNDSMEHSFQLVTAQISPLENSEGGFFQKNQFPRESISSSGGSGGEEIVHKIRYKRSTSVPRSEHEANFIGIPLPSTSSRDGKSKLKTKSKSDWTIVSNNTKKDGGNRGRTLDKKSSQNQSKGCNCSSSSSSRGKKSFTRTLSDSDLNSDDGEEPERNPKKERASSASKFQTSKSLHDFKSEQSDDEEEEDDEDDAKGKRRKPSKSLDWATSEPALCKSKSGSKLSILNRQHKCPKKEVEEKSGIRNNVLVRPLTHSASKEGKYVALIQPEMPKEVVGNKNGKRSSLRNSIKNIFSMKKREKSKEMKPPPEAEEENDSEEWGSGSYRSFKKLSLDGREISRNPCSSGRISSNNVMNFTPIFPIPPNSLPHPRIEPELSVVRDFHGISEPKERSEYLAHYIEDGEVCTNI